MLGVVTREEGDHILEGALHCTNSRCLREYPIIDGIPIIIPNTRSFISDNIFQIFMRQDLTEASESMLADGCGPGALLDQVRQESSCYAWDHYASLDPKEPAGGPQPGSAQRILEQAVNLITHLPDGPVVDLGCAVGGTTFAICERLGRMVLGIDTNFSMLRMAAHVLRQGQVRYARKRVGLAYDRREFPVRYANMDQVDFWCCDATALPLADKSFSLAVALNLLDAVAGPRNLLMSIGRILVPSGRGIITTPYEWESDRTPIEAWLGGHSQRGPDRGASEPVLRALLTSGLHPQSIKGLEITTEVPNVTWRKRLFARGTMEYQVHLAITKAVTPQG